MTNVRYELTLYNNVVPNKKGHLHYIYKAPRKLLDKLASYEALTLAPTKYTYVNNKVIIADTEDINYKKITYIAIKKYTDLLTPTEVTFYFVNSALHYSGKYYFNTEMDLFATYIGQASIASMFVNRCNKNLLNHTSSGYIEPIKECRINNALVDMIYIPLGGDDIGMNYYNTIKLDKLNVLVIANNVVGQNPVTQEYATTTQAYTINLKTLIDVYRKSGDTYNPDFSILDVMQSLISNIKGIDGIVKFDFNILNCYLVPSSWVYESSYFINVVSTLPWTEKVEYKFPLTLANANRNIDYIEIDYSKLKHYYKYYLGTFNNGIDYMDFVGKNTIEFEIIYTNTGCEIKIRQGDNVKDITSSFAFSSNGNSKNNDILQNIALSANAIANALKTAGNIASADTKGEAATTAANAVLGQIGRLGNRASAQGQNGNSNAISTYSYSGNSRPCSDDKVDYPLVLFGIKAEKNIDVLTRVNGAIYNDYSSTLSFDFNSDEFLGEEASYIQESKYTYLQAIIDLDNLQADIADFIEAEFENGLYYEYL